MGLREGDPSDDVGVPAYRNGADVVLGRVLALPFVPQVDHWSR